MPSRSSCCLAYWLPFRQSLAFVGKIRTEFQKEGTEVLIEAAVVMVDQCGRFDDPGVGPLGLGVVALFGAIHRALLLRLADEYHSVPLKEPGSHLCRKLVFALPFLEIHRRDPTLPHELLDRFHEVPRHRLNGVGGGDLGSSLLADESQRSFDDFQTRDDGVQIHAVNGFDLQSDVLPQYIGDVQW
jgi:hypothetical protein